jgi:signal transduction histidine kinase/ligand-binding sensor domain-containing protein
MAQAQQAGIPVGGDLPYINQLPVLQRNGVKKIHTLFRDSRHLVWIGTENGLYLFDGTGLTYLRHQAGQPATLVNNNVHSIQEDKEGYIWVGTFGGVSRIDPFSLQCRNYNVGLHNMTADFDNKVVIDQEGNVWAGNQKGLEKLDKKHDRFVQVWSVMYRNAPEYITHLVQCSGDSLAVGTFANLFIINLHQLGYRKVSLYSQPVTITRLYTDPYKNLWVGTWGHCFFVADPQHRNFVHYQWGAPTPLSPGRSIVFDFLETNTGSQPEIWVLPEDGGVVQVPLTVQGIPNLQAAHFKTHLSGLAGNNALLDDGEGFIWIGGNNGVIRFSNQHPFQVVTTQPRGVVREMQQIVAKKDTQLAISSWHGHQGLVLYNEKTRQHRIMAAFSSSGDAYNMSGLAKDRYGRYWVATFDGVWILDSNLQVLISLAARSSGKPPSNQRAVAIFIARDTVWVSRLRDGLDLYDLNFHRLKHFGPGASGLKEDLIWKIDRDAHGGLWFCGNTQLYHYVYGSTPFQAFDLGKEQEGYSLNDMCFLPNGHLLVATDIGLFNFDPAMGKSTAIPFPSYMQKDEAVTSVAVGREGNVWYITSDHLIRYQVRTGQFTVYGEEDGLDVQKELQCIRTFDSTHFYLAQQGQVLTFDPSQLNKYAGPPPLHFHSIQVNDSNIALSRQSKPLQLNYDQNKLFIEFDGVNYVKPEQNLYAYQLVGLDKTWIVTPKNFVSYSSLPPGRYRFMVKAANYTGAWGTPKWIDVFIKPPFWKTWWFIGVMILLLGTGFFFLVSFIVRKNLREKILQLEKEQAVEKERNRIARDMHDDLGSGLTKIAILSEVAKAQLEIKDAAIKHLDTISHSSRELVDNLQNIIWVLNPLNDSLENLAAYIREFALKFFESTHVAVHFHYPNAISPVKLSEEQRRNLFLVIKETLHNSAKHAHCKNVTIRMQYRHHTIFFHIEDDGTGFDTSCTRIFGNGLKNMQMRMEQLNGRYTITSDKGKGTCTSLRVPV